VNHLVQSTGSPLDLLGAFILIIAEICLPTTTCAGQLKPASKSGAESSSLQAETGTLQTTQVAKEPPSCTPETSTQGDTRPSAHSVTLSWKASTSPGVVGYNVYRSVKTPDRFSKINPKPVSTTSCIDYFVQLGQKYYYYVVTSDRPGVPESAHSNIASAQIPPQ